MSITLLISIVLSLNNSVSFLCASSYLFIIKLLYNVYLDCYHLDQEYQLLNM